jgi:hypothetical protein
VLLQIAFQVLLVSQYMYIHLLHPLSNQDCVPLLERDSPKEDTLHDSQFVRRENLARINGTASLKRPPIECSHCNVPVDSPKVLKVLLGAVGPFKQLLRSLFEVNKKKRFFRDEATNASCTVSIRIMFSSARDAKTNASRIVKEFEVDRMEPITKTSGGDWQVVDKVGVPDGI